MAAIYNKFVIVILTLFVAIVIISSTQGARLSDPKILLPYHSTVVTNFTLQINITKEELHVHDSCYTWRSTQQEVATVQLVNSTDGECAFSAVISAVSKSSHRKTSIVLAENKVTREVLRCIVIVESLHRFEIQTTTRLLYLEDSPEELTIRGFDEEGNVFSSLAGLRFEWSLESDTSADQDTVIDASNILRIIKFSESHYTRPAYIDRLEGRGLQGDMILVEGIRTGSANVKSVIRDRAYKNVVPSVVKIMVIANLMVSPAEAYVLKYSTVRYTVELIKQNSIIEIAMPSEQFYLEVQNHMICEFNAQTSFGTAAELGSTEIVLMDKNIKSQDVLMRPSAMMYVVTPSRLAFVILPHNKWVLETGREYEILIEVYDKNSHKVYPSDNVIIKATFPTEYFQVLSSTKNGTYHLVKTLDNGKTMLDGALTSVIRTDGSEYPITPPVKQMQVVEIYDPILVKPAELFFPWDPQVPISHQYQLEATGGSGEYIWKSSQPQISTVNMHGEITTGQTGGTNVTAADTRNQAHWGLSSVWVLPPSDMQFRPKRVEAAVGTDLEIPLAVFALFEGTPREFNDCRMMRLNVTFTDQTVFQYLEGNNSLPENGCRFVKVNAVIQGHTEVKASYIVGNIQLESTVTIAAYDPLQAVDPEKEAVVAVGSLKEVVFRGGPQPWVIDSSKYFQNLSPENPSIVNQYQLGTFGNSRGFHNFLVTCKDIGRQRLMLRVGNGKTAKNKYPATEEVSIIYNCAAPVELHLTPLVKMPDKDLPPCPVIRDPTQSVPVHCSRDLDILVTVTDSAGNKFDNISSLEFEWTHTDHSLGSLALESGLMSEVATSSEGVTTVKNFQTLNPAGRPGYVTITATVNRYSDKHLKEAGSRINAPISPPISKSLQLKLVEEAIVSPDMISVFNHPSNKVTVHIRKGSGYFFIHPAKSDIVKIDYSDQKHEMLVKPVSDGSLSVTVFDLCIDVPDPPVATVFVSGVGSVQLSAMDKVEVGKDFQAKVKVLDMHGKPLQASFFPLMGLRLVPASTIITVKPDLEATEDKFTSFYTVHGAVVGHTSLEARATPRPDVTVTSVAKAVEVFPPLQLIPRNITLIIGALFQVLSKGGPTPQCTVLFSIASDDIALVSSSGLLDAQELGSTRVIGQAVGQDPETGETIIYSQDEAQVHVVPLTDIRIHAPLTRLQTGTRMPMYAVGATEHETPFTFGSAIPPLTFSWSVSNKDVVFLENVFHSSGVFPQEQSDFANQLVAREPGRVTVKLEVTPTRFRKVQVSGHVQMTDELQIEVFQKLAVISPSVCDGKLLMTPNTEAVVKTNRDGAAKVTYTVLPSSGDLKVVAVGDGGLLSSGPKAGEAALHITSQEEFGTNQTLVVLIKVKPVSYMMINSDTVLRTSGGLLKKIPVGSTLHLSVSYHDNIGEQFYATNVKMHYRFSRYDLVQAGYGVENNTLVVKVSDVGQTILKVWDKQNPWLADYINIHGDYAIMPIKVVMSLGEIVCFQSSLVSEKGYRGAWYSSNGNIYVDKDSGIAMAKGVGQAFVDYNISNTVSTYMEVTVSPIRKLTLDNSPDHLTNVETRGKTPFITVILDGENEVLGENCSAKIQENHYHPKYIPFWCELELSTKTNDIGIEDLFTTQPDFDPKTGKFGCQINQVSRPVMLQQISTLNVDVALSVGVASREGQPEVMAQQHVFSFLPSFYIHQSEVHLSTLNQLSSIRVSTVSSLTDCIEVFVSDPSILESLSPEKDTQSGAVLLYPIRLIESAALWERDQIDVHIEMVCQKTGQKVKLPVFVSLIGQKPDYISTYRGSGWQSLVRNIFYNYQSWLFIILVIILTALAVIIGYHAVFGPKYRAANAGVFMGPGGAASPITYSPQALMGPQYSPYAATPKTPYLWSPGYSPVDGSTPRQRRSPYNRQQSP
ncbi:nuclear pore membrane glycoprotein 210-like isoform X2 [Mizuhopecten yessoensis]|uniref:nuclear pore membrane glycoprotein 210-like isoform X2 n=1 Tax=Mizuhopecten yessoensis TaxID=6573 RepID=UPI000B45D728|nr:nuclear pore membrane glycoprotein 210-like isoform X2 [Mizuhopecten yessoensis]